MTDGWERQRRQWARMAAEARATEARETEASATIVAQDVTPPAAVVDMVAPTRPPQRPAAAPAPAPAPAPARVIKPVAAQPRKLAIRAEDIPSAMEERAKRWTSGA